MTDGSEVWIDNPANLPAPTEIERMEEPMCSAHIMTPPEYVGTIMELCIEKRGIFIDMVIPLNEIIFDFFDSLKSRSRGYASFDYEISEYVPSDLVKLDFLLNGDMCDALSTIVHRDKAYAKGRAVAEKLQEVSSLKFRFRLRSAAKSLPERPCVLFAKMFLQNATAATSRVKRSCLKSKKKVKSA